VKDDDLQCAGRIEAIIGGAILVCAAYVWGLARCSAPTRTRDVHSEHTRSHDGIHDFSDRWLPAYWLWPVSRGAGCSAEQLRGRRVPVELDRAPARRGSKCSAVSRRFAEVLRHYSARTSQRGRQQVVPGATNHRCRNRDWRVHAVTCVRCPRIRERYLMPRLCRVPGGALCFGAPMQLVHDALSVDRCLTSDGLGKRSCRTWSVTGRRGEALEQKDTRLPLFGTGRVFVAPAADHIGARDESSWSRTSGSRVRDPSR